jgi:hypothetical protein
MITSFEFCSLETLEMYNYLFAGAHGRTSARGRRALHPMKVTR